jgi:hypothetical protein
LAAPKIDHAFGGQQFGDACNGANKQFVADSKGTGNWQILDALNLQQAFIWNDENGIAMFPKSFQSPFCILLPKGTFGLERIRYNCDGHGSLRFG